MKLAQSGRNFTPVTNRMLPLMLHESRVKDAPLVKVIREMAERTGIEAYIRQQNAIIARPDYRALLPSIACPTLVLCGRQDRLTPIENSEEMAAQYRMQVWLSSRSAATCRRWNGQRKSTGRCASGSNEEG